MSPNVPQNVTIGTQNMCSETSGPRGSFSHAGSGTVAVPVLVR